jgi:hypothetical protein
MRPRLHSAVMPPDRAPAQAHVEALAERVAAAFARVPEVLAVALGGSRGSGGVGHDGMSDLDLEVYTRSPLSREARETVMVDAGARPPLPVDHAFWGAADEWMDPGTGIVVDAAYFDAAWMEDQLARVLVRHEPSLGYSTCFWHTIRGSRPLHDPEGWLARQQERADVPYPEPLRTAIIAFNRAALRGFPSSWEAQVTKAAERGDPVAANHRVAGLLASCFDIVFAVNRVPHPGEKRLLDAATDRCPVLPPSFDPDVRRVLAAAATMDGSLPAAVARLLDGLDALVAREPGPGGRAGQS